MSRSVAFAPLPALLLLLLAPSAALGHAELVSADPGPGDRVIGSPSELVARFSQNLDPSRTSLEVRNVSGATVARGGRLGSGPREFRLALPALAPGRYQVRWTSFSTEDRELDRGTYTFTVVAAATPTPTLTATPSSTAARTPSPSPSASPPPAAASGDTSALIPIAAGLLAVGAIGVWLLRRGPPATPTGS